MSNELIDVARARPMGRPKKIQSGKVPKRNDVPVRIDETVLEDIRLVATLRKISISDYLSEIMRPIAKKDAEAEINKRSQAMNEEKKRKSN